MKFCRRSSFCCSVNDARSPALVAGPLPPVVTEGASVAGPPAPAVTEVAVVAGPPDGTETLLLSTEVANGIVADGNELLRAGLSPDLLSDTNCGGENLEDADEDADEGANDADDADDAEEGADDDDEGADEGANDADDDEGADEDADDADDEGADDEGADDDEPPPMTLEYNGNNSE